MKTGATSKVDPFTEDMQLDRNIACHARPTTIACMTPITKATDTTDPGADVFGCSEFHSSIFGDSPRSKGVDGNALKQKSECDTSNALDDCGCSPALDALKIVDESTTSVRHVDEHFSKSTPDVADEFATGAGTDVSKLRSNPQKYAVAPKSIRNITDSDSRYPEFFKNTILRFLELTLKTSKLNLSLMECVQMSKEAVRIISWLKDTDSECGSDNFSESTSGRHGSMRSVISQTLHMRDYCLLERDLKHLEKRMNDICSNGGGDAGAGGMIQSEDISSGARSGNTTAADLLAQRLNTMKRVGSENNVSGTGGAAYTAGKHGVKCGGESGGAISSFSTGFSRTANTTALCKASNVGGVSREMRFGSNPNKIIVNRDNDRQGAGKEEFSEDVHALLPLLSKADSSSTAIASYYGIEDATFALLVKDLLVPLLRQQDEDRQRLAEAQKKLMTPSASSSGGPPVPKQEKVPAPNDDFDGLDDTDDDAPASLANEHISCKAQSVAQQTNAIASSSPGSKVSGRKGLLQRQMHEAEWTKKLNQHARNIEQLLLLFTMVVKISSR